MQTILQDDQCSCGPCCIAMVADVPREAAAKAASYDGTRCGMSVCAVATALQTLSGEPWAVVWHDDAPLASFDPGPGRSVLLIREDSKGERHFVATEGGKLFCPIEGGPIPPAKYQAAYSWVVQATVASEESSNAEDAAHSSGQQGHAHPVVKMVARQHRRCER